MRLVLFAFTLLVFVSGILANIITTTTTPKPILRPGGKTAYRSVGGNSRRSRHVNGGQPDQERQRDEELKKSGSDLHGVGSQSKRMGRDVSMIAAVDQIPMWQDNRFPGSLTERDLASTDGYIRARMRRDNTKRASLKKLSTKSQPKKDQSKNKLHSIASSLGPLRARRA